MQQQATSSLFSTFFSLFGLEVFIERTQHKYPQWFAVKREGAGEIQALILGNWRVSCSW